jgi:purine-binding chemotaxis protein CheW
VIAEPPADKKLILRQRAQTLSKESGPTPEAGEFIELVTFLLAGEKYGIESRYVNEVYSLKELTPVPCTPTFVLGITNVRGKILSVIDIKEFFDLLPKGLSELDEVVIVGFNQVEVGIRADAILGMQPIAAAKIQAGLPTLTGIREKYLKGVTPDRLIILDVPKLLTDADIIVSEEVER